MCHIVYRSTTCTNRACANHKNVRDYLSRGWLQEVFTETLSVVYENIVNKPSPDGDAKEQIGCNLYTYTGNFVGNFQEWASYSSRALMYMVHCEDRYWSWVSSLCGTESFGGQLDTQYALFLKQQQKLGSHSASANWDYIAPPINYYYISVMWLDIDTSTSTTLQPQWIPFIASA